METTHTGPIVEKPASGGGSDADVSLRLRLRGIEIDQMPATQALELVALRLHDPAGRALAIGSVNLDHVHHFGDHRVARGPQTVRLGANLEWLMLVDGAPVAWRAGWATGAPWPRLTGADLLPDLLTMAERTGAKVGFLGGDPDSVPALLRRLERDWPGLRPVSCWTPSRATVTDRQASAELADEIADAAVDLLVVGLGKPLQERWIEAHGTDTLARVLCAFGGAANFLAGVTSRAPAWMRRSGCEWAYRLLKEPRRLWRRYLLEGPGALLALKAAPTVADRMLPPLVPLLPSIPTDIPTDPVPPLRGPAPAPPVRVP